MLQDACAQFPTWKVLVIMGLGALVGVAPGIMLGKAAQHRFDQWFYKLTPNIKRPWWIG